MQLGTHILAVQEDNVLAGAEFGNMHAFMWCAVRPRIDVDCP